MQQNNHHHHQGSNSPPSSHHGGNNGGADYNSGDEYAMSSSGHHQQGGQHQQQQESSSGSSGGSGSGHQQQQANNKAGHLMTMGPTEREEERRFEKKMRKKGLVLKRMGEDGACLFRSVADQVYGDENEHNVVRRLCCDYMAKNGDYFSQYVTEDFGQYVERKRRDNCYGNHVEIQALSELFNRKIEVYVNRSQPINIFQGGVGLDQELDLNEFPIRLRYHDRLQHYDSLVDPYTATIGVGLGLPAFNPGLADRQLMQSALVTSETDQLEKQMLEDKLRATDWEATNEVMEEQVARESYLSWLRENEARRRHKDGRVVVTSSHRSGGGALQPQPQLRTTSSSGSSGSVKRIRSRSNSPQAGASVEDSHLNLGSNLGEQGGGYSGSGTGSYSGGNMMSSGTQHTRKKHKVHFQQTSPTSRRSHRSSSSSALSNTDHQHRSSPPPSSSSLEEDEGIILARVLAESRQDYLDKLRQARFSGGQSSSSNQYGDDYDDDDDNRNYHRDEYDGDS